MKCTDCKHYAKETRKAPPHCTHPDALDCIRQRLPQSCWYGRGCTISSMIPGRPASVRRTRARKQTMLNMWGMII